MMDGILKILAVELDVVEEIEDWLGLCEWRKRSESPRKVPFLHHGHLLCPRQHLV